ncbi:MAG: mannose-1-phosphate guanylyltransferase/mannose-6-phosphate isomerase [Gammaproteobacteria bacterium]|nr:mannose-1-phosphate guanylyltransferase/mannose-6-phosphate isomerase [Gammaproteobacteria bacterium]
MSKQVVPIILAGGSGTRLWPLSRLHYPKQFLTFAAAGSLLQETVRRAELIPTVEQILVVCNEEYRFLVEGQVRDCAQSKWHILLESSGRNTAPAAALAIMYGQSSIGDCVYIVMPSDHLIQNLDAFVAAMAEGVFWAEQDKLVTFGVAPTSADTGFGYIQKGSPLPGESGDAYSVAKFIEKPDHERATQFLTQGNYLWNSGMFVFRGEKFLAELGLHTGVAEPCRRALAGKSRDGNFVRPDPEAWTACPNVSIDHGVMEHTTDAIVVPLRADWNDVGTWSRVAALLDVDPAGNAMHGNTILHDVKNSCIYADKRLVTAVGVRDLIVIETADAVLVVDKNSDQSVKQLVERLRSEQHKEAEFHTEVYRPWGSFVNLDRGEGYQVKRLVLKPQEGISLQRHHRRAEHWIVVKGEALVTRDGEQFALRPNESTYIPRETMHKLENQGAEDLEVIEVQTGAYLEEDDIERFEDRYGRT